MALPYWDWEKDDTFPPFLGGDGSLVRIQNREPIIYVMPVNDGPVASTNGWFAVDGNGAPIGPLQRAFGTEQVPLRDPNTGDLVPDLATGQPVQVPATLANLQQQVQHALSIAQYDADPWDESGHLESFRNVMEGWWWGPRLHNQLHVWVGGSMGPGTSPNDPIFFLHHCNVDRLWVEWLNSHPTADYQPQSGGPQGHNLNDFMFPWDGVATTDTVAPSDVLTLANVTYAPPSP